MVTKERRSGGSARRATRGADGAGELTPPIAILCVLLTASKVGGAALSFMVLMSGLPEPIFLGIALSTAAVTLTLLQQPWNSNDKRPISQAKLRRIAIGGISQALILAAWMAGLRASGPTRAFLIESAELPLLYLFAVVTTRDVPNRKKNRGAFLMLLGYMLLIYDASGRVNHHLEKLRHTRAGHRAEIMKDAAQRHIHNSVHHLRHSSKIVPPMEHPDKDALDMIQKQLDAVKANMSSPERLKGDTAQIIRDSINELGKPDKHADDDRVPAANRRSLLEVHDGSEYEDGDEHYEDYTDYENYDDYSEQSGTEVDSEPLSEDEGDQRPGARDAKANSNREETDPHRGQPHRFGQGKTESVSDHPPKAHRTFLHSIFVSRALRSEIGVLLLLLTAVISQSSRGFSRRVAAEVGGAKRYFALATGISALFTLPFALLSFYLLAERRREVVMSPWPVVASASAGLLYIVVPFYLKSIVSPQMKQTTLMKMNLTGPTTMALTLALIVGPPIRHFLIGFKISFLVVLALVVETVGMGIMTAGRLNQELPMMDSHNSR